MIKKKEFAGYVFIALLIILCYVAFLIIKPFFTAILSSCILTYVFFPLHKRLMKLTKNKQHLCSALTLIIIILLVIIPMIVSIGSLAQSFSGDLKYVGNLLSDEIHNADLATTLKDVTGFSIEPKAFTDLISQKVISFGNSFIASLPQRALSIFVMLFLTYYLLILGPDLVQKTYEIIPFKKKVKYEILSNFKDVTYAIIFGNIITALAQGFTGYVGYLIFGVKGAIFFAVMTSFFSLFPVVGTTVIWIPAALSLLINGKIPNGIGLFIYGVFIISLVDNFIKPKIIGDRANIHPALVLLGVVGGISVFGFIGLFVGPMIFALLITFIKVYKIQNPDWKKKEVIINQEKEIKNRRFFLRNL